MEISKGILPCLGVLAGRHIPLIPEYPLCKIVFEDIQHCLFTCSRAKDVWAELGLIDRTTVMQDRFGSVNSETLIHVCSVVRDIPVAELILVAMWYI